MLTHLLSKQPRLSLLTWRPSVNTVEGPLMIRSETGWVIDSVGFAVVCACCQQRCTTDPQRYPTDTSSKVHTLYILSCYMMHVTHAVCCVCFIIMICSLLTPTVFNKSNNCSHKYVQYLSNKCLQY